MSVTYKYRVGDEVEAHDWSGTGLWRPCRITHLAPHGHRSSQPTPGYYVQWLDVIIHPDPVTGILESQGGWQSENTIRPRRGE